MKKQWKLSVIVMIFALMLGVMTAQAATAKKTVRLTSTGTKSSVGLIKGATLQLTAKKNNSTVKASNLTFRTSKKSVATVSGKGIVTAKKAGKAIITIQTKTAKNRVKAYLTVTVKNPTLKTSAASVLVNTGKQATVTITANAPKEKLSYKVTSGSGNISLKWGKWSGTTRKLYITGVKAGAATIKVSGSASKKNVTIKVTVSSPKLTDKTPISTNLLSNVSIFKSNKDIEIIDAGYSIGDYNYLYYSFILHNYSDKVYEYPTVNITARNKYGIIIRTESQTVGTIYPHQNYAWGSSAFQVSEEPAKVEFDVSIPSYGATLSSELTHPKYIPLVVSGVTSHAVSDEDEGTIFSGEVINKNDYDINSGIAVVVLFRNSNGCLLGGEVTFPSGVTANGGHRAFELWPSPMIVTNRYDFYAYPW